MKSNSMTQNVPILKSNKNFRFLCIGSLISMLGDQLTLISLPWLALFLSPEPWVIGSVMAVMAIPMSLLILFGGAIVDRYSAKRVLLYTKWFNTLLMAVLAILLFSNMLTLALLYAIVLLIGTSSAFAIPAGSALLPQIIQAQALPKANSIGMTLRSVTTMIGPLLAALLLGLELTETKDVTHNQQAQSLVLVFSIDAVSFAISALILKYVRPNNIKVKRKDPIKHSIISGLKYFWSLRELRLLVIYIALITSFLGGMIQVGLPLLVKNQWNQGADIFGVLMAVFASGNILGMFSATKTMHMRRLTLGSSILLADLLVGVFLIMLSNAANVWQGMLILILMGVMAGYIQIVFISWVQQQATSEMLGRLMSIVMFGLIGLIPLGTSLAGGILQFISISSFFLLSGAMLSIVALIAIYFSDIPNVKAAVFPQQAD